MTPFETPEQTDFLAKRLLVLRIIIGALLFGLVALIGIAFLVISLQAPNNAGQAAAAPQAGPSQPILTYVACLFAVMAIPLSVIVPQLTVASARKTLASRVLSKEEELAGLVDVYQSKTIICAAIREGVGHLGAIAYMLERSPIALGLTLVFLIAVAVLFPTRDRLESWLDDQLARLSQDRELMKSMHEDLT